MIDVADGALDTGATRLMQAVCDTICPWCHIGKRRLAAALGELGPKVLAFQVIWRPFQLNPGMPRAGLDRRA